ncbi:hypothetical protein NLG97_g10094 [Lecanicillium saksenae]|uniref:Uncharacterized protein n=1 Tax=Lecanicillium saksenae TaxID=468837 RepID=A0ACC1QFV2_9HYPO|nr:hypothetical protein NLG97_g10094 [Lecanicillium saksenae]
MKSVILSTLVMGALGYPAVDTHVVHEKRDTPLVHYTRGDAAGAETKLPVQIALAQSNLAEGANKLLDVSNPKSSSYGQHLTPQQVIDLFAANSSTIDSVTNWLVSSGVPKQDITLDKTRTNKLTGRDHIGADKYSLPKEIAGLVDFVRPAVGLTELPRRQDTTIKPNPSAAGAYAVKEPFVPLTQDLADRLAANRTIGCDEVITPECIRQLYKIPLENKPEYVNDIGIWESGDTFDQEDLDLFWKNYAKNVPAGTTPKLALINGATAPVRQQDGGGESLLDFQIAYPIIQPQGAVLFQNAFLRNDFSQVFADYLSAIDQSFCKTDPNYNKVLMCGKYEPTNVLSISYGDAEMDEPTAIVQRVCNEFMKLGLIGVTVVVSSGDTGVASRGNTCAGPHHDIFTPSFLAVCPYVTAVGSTYLPKGRKIGDSEIVTDSFSPGGGFSNIFPRPDWQNKAVSKYLLRHNPNYFSYETSNGTIPTDTRGIYNRAGRAYPDVAAAGQNGLVVYNGVPNLSGGTSMSAPIVASIFNRINDARMSLGKGPIGFANPALYAAADTVPGFYNDITEGNQFLGGIFSDRGLSSCGNNGFTAVEGWDPVTGFGTPNYPVWESYWIEL